MFSFYIGFLETLIKICTLYCKDLKPDCKEFLPPCIYPPIQYTYACTAGIVFEWDGVVKCLVEKFGVNPRIREEPLKMLDEGVARCEKGFREKNGNRKRTRTSPRLFLVPHNSSSPRSPPEFPAPV